MKVFPAGFPGTVHVRVELYEYIVHVAVTVLTVHCSSWCHEWRARSYPGTCRRRNYIPVRYTVYQVPLTDTSTVLSVIPRIPTRI